MNIHVSGEMVEAGSGDGIVVVGSAHRTMAGIFSIPDEMWERIAPLIPEHVNTHRFGGGPSASARSQGDGRDFLRASYRRSVAGA
jgi:hypothetical protein